MNKKEFDLISRDRIIHSAITLHDDTIENFYGARSYGFPTICRFENNAINVTDYYTKELLLELPYNELANLEVSVCSRLVGVGLIPYFIYYGHLIIRTISQRIYVIEFRLSNRLFEVSNLLESKQVNVIDRIGIIAATKNYEEERVYQFISDNIDNWSTQFSINHPQKNDFITLPSS